MTRFDPVLQSEFLLELRLFTSKDVVLCRSAGKLATATKERTSRNKRFNEACSYFARALHIFVLLNRF